MFELTPPTITLQIAPDALPGGLASWGTGSLEVEVRGDVSLDRYFDLVDRLSGVTTSAADGSQTAHLRQAFADFAALLVSWNIAGIECTPDAFGRLPQPLAIAIFTAWVRAASLPPTSSAA